MIKTRLFSLLGHAKKYIIANVLWQWIGLWLQILFVFTLSTAIVTRSFPILRLLVCILGRIVCDRMVVRNSFLASVDVKRILRENIYRKIVRLGSSYTEKIATSEIVQVSTEGVEQLETYFGKYLPQLFYSLLAPITLFVVLCRVSFKSSVVLLVCVPLIPISIVVVQKIAKRLLNRYWDTYTKLGDSFLENLQGLTTLKIYQADEQMTARMDQESDLFRRVTMRVLTMQLNSTSIMDIVAYGGAAVGIATALGQYISGDLSLVSTIRIVLLASEFFLPLRLLGSYFHIAMNGMAASDKIFAILDLDEGGQGQATIHEGPIHIEMNHVDFSYSEQKQTLFDVNLSIEPKSFVSIVGASGCGKSTVAKILSGRIKGYKGEIAMNDIPLNDIDEMHLHQRVVLVQHNSHIFKGTIKENLLMAKPDATDDELLSVLKHVNLLDFKLDDFIEENASNISGGQAQRLVIARSLLKNADVYIFDEATSNIDIESEEIIMNVIHSMTHTKTVILISHRLANVVDSDVIYMMKDGKIMEHGTHDELIHQGSAYATLFHTQKELEDYGKEAI